MKILNLRNNAFQRIEPSIAKELPGLVKLDLSGNKISVIEKNSFVGLTLLEELSLDNNQISEIHDGEFNGLKNLKTLNLANNKLAKITKNTFNGLDNLEILILKGNNLADVDWAAFSGLKKLRTLDLGTNQLTNIELRRLQNLQRLYLNNNSIQSLKNVVLRDLSNLVSLSLDRNSITRISDDDLSDLSQSGRLTSLSIVSNKISEIESRAFEHVHELSILSLQHNELTQLTSPTANGMVPFLRPLKKLKSLYLSNNKIAKIDADSLQGLVRLKEISLDHNNIRTVDTGAFHDIHLNKLFLNGNQLYYLPKGLFDEWNKNDIYAIDLSDNVWECVCSGGEEWLANWLHSVGEANTPQGKLGCLIEQCVPSTTDHPPWIIAIAIAFSTISVVCIIVIAFLLLQEGKRPRLPSFMNHIQRVPSDREKLISDHLAFPNPVTSIPDQVMPTRASIKLAGSSNNGTRKKVHFDDS
uniref:Uncharacterized protein n=1 Tax=Acrobeloides nanus TaxID=290746 RepID=A0A914C1D2_9BILA